MTRTTLRERRRGRTDTATLEAIAERVSANSDAGPLDIDWSQADLIVPPRKAAISIRLDADVIAFFKGSGNGYQSRINAVLRSYMRAKDGEAK